MTYCWYFTREDIDRKTPSREDGIPAAVETRYRRDGAKFLINASNTFGLHYETTATGVVFFHRFFMIQSFKQFDRYVVAAACLLLAGKVEETPKKCKDILKTTRSLLNDQQIMAFGSNHKEELLTHERILLQTIKFDLQVVHPYSYLLTFGKGLRGDKAKIEKLVQMAWTFVNDSLCTTLCLQWEPQALAVAFIYLAGKLTKYDLQAAAQSRSRSWWRNFVDTLDIHDLESICHQVLDIYGENEEPQDVKPEGPPPSQPEQPPQQPPPLYQPTLQQPQYTMAGAPLAQPQPHTSTKPPSHLQFQPKQASTLQQLSAVAPPSAPPTQGATATTTVAGMSTFQTHSSFLTAPGSFTSFGLANPLQALQNILPARQQAATTPAIGGNQHLAYSTLNVSVANTRLTTLQQIYGSSIHPGTPLATNASKTLLHTTPTASSLGMLGGYRQHVFQQPVVSTGYQLGSTVVQGGIGQGILPSPAKRPAFDSPYRLQPAPIPRTLTPTQPQSSHPLPPTTNIANMALLGRLPNVMTQGQYLSALTPTLSPALSSQLQAQNPMAAAPGSIRTISPQVGQPRPQQHQPGYNPAAGGNSWMR